MNPLDPTERRALRAKAHHLEPVVTIGHHGLTPPVLHEIDVALLAHDLVKVRVLGGDRDAREAMLAQVCATLDCAPVQHLGKVLVLWRPNPERRKKAPKAAEPAKPARKRPAKRTPVDPVRERRRAARSEEAAPRGDQARRRRRTV
jgi:putative YhbY family RNA-binding protein